MGGMEEKEAGEGLNYGQPSLKWLDGVLYLKSDGPSSEHSEPDELWLIVMVTNILQYSTHECQLRNQTISFDKEQLHEGSKCESHVHHKSRMTHFVCCDSNHLLVLGHTKVSALPRGC